MANRFVPTGRATTKSGLSASEIFKAKLNGKGSGARPDVKAIMQEKLAQYQRERMEQGMATKFGTGPNGEMSKGAKIMMEKMLAKQAKKDAKKKRAEVVIKSGYLGTSGGRIDGSGNIYGANGQVVGKIDAKTGKVKNALGMAVGKYNPESSYSMHQLEKMAKKAAPVASTGAFGSGGGSGFFGSGNGAGAFGSGAGNGFFGSGSSDGGGGWWGK